MGFATLAVALAAVTHHASTSVESFFAPSAATLRPTAAAAAAATTAAAAVNTWGSSSSSSSSSSGRRGGTALRMKYVPDGLTPEEWKKMQEKEAGKKKGLNLGYLGVKGFKSRSLQAWQEDGASHLFPVNPKKVKTGEISQEKTPYMQRGGGAWDNSDLVKKKLKGKTGKPIPKKRWSETDKEYAKGGFAKELSASIFPHDPLKWNASKPFGSDDKRSAAGAQKKQRGAKNAAQKKNAGEEKKLKAQVKSEGKKGLFGLW